MSIFQNRCKEHSAKLEPYSGAIPHDLSGVYVKNGPGEFEIGNNTLDHWFDGSAFLHAFTFKDCTLHYQSQFLKTKHYVDSHAKKRLVYPLFASVPKFKWWEIIREVITGRRSGNNSAISTQVIAGRYFALTESTGMTEFELGSLETIQHFEFDDNLNNEGKTTTAHPIYDKITDEFINVDAVPGPTCWHNYYRIDNKTLKRHVIGKVGSQFPSYTHSFGLTPRYIIHTEFPLVVHPISLILRFGFISYIKAFKWKPEFGTKITLINRSTGAIDHEFTVDPCFAFHHVNAREEDGSIVFDICEWPSNKIINDLYLDNLQRSTGRPIEEKSLLTRYSLNLDDNTTSKRVISNKYIEVPTYNQDCAFSKYRYCYGLSYDRPDFDNSIVKIDIETGNHIEWSEENYYAGEPLFVARANSLAEDDGYILTVVAHCERDKSFLMCLNAADFSEIFRAKIPGHVLPSVHGTFYSQ